MYVPKTLFVKTIRRGGEEYRIKGGGSPHSAKRKTPLYMVLALVDAAADGLTVGSRQRSPARPASR